MERIESAPAGASLASMFRGCSDEEWVWVLTEGRARVDRLRKMLPTLPDEHQQRRFTGRHDQEAFRQAAAGVSLFLEEARALGLDTARPDLRVIDVGCGWGRITQALLRDFEPAQLIGCDVMAEALDICRSTGLPVELLQLPYMPPADLPDASADLIVAFSVFSHLAERPHRAWVEDFARVLRPGGVLVVTTRPRAFIQYAQSVRQQGDVADHERGAASAFQGSGAWLEAYDRGEFCFDGDHRGGSRPDEYYGEAAVPGAFAERAWSPMFTDIRFTSAGDHGRFDQSVIAARVPG
ncbi:MAG: class I SAM-dependent methyltransferase [Planctomycetota bacterium]